MIVINYRDQRWKMRMFKRLEAAQHFGKRPDRWGLVFFLTCICIWHVNIGFSMRILWELVDLPKFDLSTMLPSRWQMRMFKREPEMNQEYQGSPLRWLNHDHCGVVDLWSSWYWLMIVVLFLDDHLGSWSWMRYLVNAQTCPTHWIHEYIRILEFCRFFNLATYRL